MGQCLTPRGKRRRESSLRQNDEESKNNKTSMINVPSGFVLAGVTVGVNTLKCSSRFHDGAEVFWEPHERVDET